MVHCEAELDVDHFALRPQKRGCLLGTGTGGKRARDKLQALVYDILNVPSTTTVFSYAIGSRKLSANEQFLLVLKQ